MMEACEKRSLSDKDFRLLSGFIEEEVGIKMPASKRSLLESRLGKRLRVLKMGSFSEYTSYLFSPEGEAKELVHMIDLVTTNKTDFLRESPHFEFLLNTALTELARTLGAGVVRPLMVWSAGSSTGEEPYTLAMVLSEFARMYPGLKYDFAILGTDISTRVLEIACRGIYPEDRVAPVPMELRQRYMLRSRDRSKGEVRMSRSIRSKVRFRRLNFMDEFRFREPMDVIFCRNVTIYFSREVRDELFRKLCRFLVVGGYMCIGHSETLSGVDLPLEKIAPAVYRRTEGAV